MRSDAGSSPSHALREAAERAVAAKPDELAVDGCDVDAGAARHRDHEPLPAWDAPDDRAERAALSLDEAARLDGRDERGVAGARAHHRPEPLGAGHENGLLPGAHGGHRAGAVAAADGAEQRRAQVGEPSRPLEAAARDDRDVGREVRNAQVGSGPRAARRVDAAERKLPAAAARREQPGLRRHVDEPAHAPAEPSCERSCELDLEAAREDHVASADDTCLEEGALETERDDECAGSARRGRRRGRVVGARQTRRQREPRDDEHGGDPPHASVSLTTSTGVPYVAKAYISGASRAIIRTQPCEAG